MVVTGKGVAGTTTQMGVSRVQETIESRSTNETSFENHYDGAINVDHGESTKLLDQGTSHEAAKRRIKDKGKAVVDSSHVRHVCETNAPDDIRRSSRLASKKIAGVQSYSPLVTYSGSTSSIGEIRSNEGIRKRTTKHSSPSFEGKKPSHIIPLKWNSGFIDSTASHTIAQDPIIEDLLGDPAKVCTLTFDNTGHGFQTLDFAEQAGVNTSDRNNKIDQNWIEYLDDCIVTLDMISRGEKEPNEMSDRFCLFMGCVLVLLLLILVTFLAYQ